MEAPSARMAVSRIEEVFGDDARSHARSHARSRSRFVGCESDIGPGRVASALASSCREKRVATKGRGRTSMGQPYAPIAGLTRPPHVSQSGETSSPFVNHIDPRRVSKPARSKTFAR